jgi:hypothetical protein
MPSSEFKERGAKNFGFFAGSTRFMTLLKFAAAHKKYCGLQFFEVTLAASRGVRPESAE